MLCILRELLRNSGGPRCVSRNMRGTSSTVCSGASQTAIETRIGLWGPDFMFRFSIYKLLYSREDELSVLSSLQRDRVMEARFDGYMIKLLHGVRAFDGSMFRREAWVDRSRSYTCACCQLMPYGPGGPSGGVGLQANPSAMSRCPSRRPPRAGA